MPIDTKELMKQVGRIKMITSRLVDERMSGEYHSMFKGQGIEFDEVREYAPGDDVRAIDWNVTARMGHPFVKRFAEERELTVLFVVDISGSQAFGSCARTKAEISAELTCLLSLSAVKNQDKVGLILFSDRIEKFIPPRKGRTAAMRLVREVLACEETRRGTDLAQALRFLNNVQKRKAVVFIVSDFLAERYLPELRVTARKHDVIGCHVDDPRESDLPDIGLIEVQDPETGEVALLDTSSPAVGAWLKERARERRQTLADMFRRLGVDALFLGTERGYMDDLRRLFRIRRMRAGRG